MDMLRLLLAGFLIASGLILGAFTLHGYLDPSWPQNRMQAANAQPAVVNPALPEPARNRNQLATEAEPQSPPPSPVVKTSARPAPPTEAKAPPRPAVKKKVADKPERPDKAPPPQPASAGFPWSLFGN